MTKLRDKIITQGASRPPVYEHKVDFRKKAFDNLIQMQGYDIIHEKAISCSCKEHGGGFKNTCKNCRGTGWIFVNPQKTKAVMSWAREQTKEESFKAVTGRVRVTTFADVNLGYFDKLTIINSLADYSQSINLEYSEELDKYVGALTYQPKEIYFVGLFQSADKALIKIDSNYTLDEDFIIFDRDYIDSILGSPEIFIPKQYDIHSIPLTENKPIMASIRYRHNPIYHMTDMVRDYMTHPVRKKNSLVNVDMPVFGYAVKRDIVFDKENLAGDKLINNSWLGNV